MKKYKNSHGTIRKYRGFEISQRGYVKDIRVEYHDGYINLAKSLYERYVYRGGKKSFNDIIKSGKS